MTQVANRDGADNGPALRGAAVTPDNDTDLATPAKALWIGGAGSGGLKITTWGGSTITLAGVPVGLLPITAKRVFATGTDVTNIVALYD